MRQPKQRHRFSTLPLWSGSLLLAALAFACGSIDPADDKPGSGGDSNAAGEGSGGAQSLEPLLPWTTGYTWTYRVTKAGEVTEKTTTVGDLSPVGGEGPSAAIMAYHVVTAKGVSSMDRTESWQGPDPENALRIVRYRERSFGAMTGDLELEEHWEPHKLHIDGSAERSVAGASWLESYTETKLEVGLSPTTHDVRERWTVIADDETLEVPAGTFDHVIHLQKAGSGATKDYWYVRGVGKLKETGTQTEELTAYSLEEAAP